MLKKWVDNEQSSNSSQADSSEESAPIVEEGDETEREKSVAELETDRLVVEAGQGLLDQWNNLKEVFKIPKKDKKDSKPVSFSSSEWFSEPRLYRLFFLFSQLV